MKDVAKMKTLYKELPYLAALSNMFSSQWQLNCHLKSHIVHPMPWMLPILMHISSTFGIDNINLKLMKLNEKVSNVAKHMYYNWKNQPRNVVTQSVSIQMLSLIQQLLSVMSM